jgi:hypothetical protein
MQNLYIDANGRVTCASHGGTYLRWAISAQPNLRRYDTPLGDWIAVTKSDMKKYALTCETCDMHAIGHDDYEDPDMETPHDEMAFSMPAF